MEKLYSHSATIKKSVKPELRIKSSPLKIIGNTKSEEIIIDKRFEFLQ